MDSSPRPQRRFSRWQTTKRTFVIGGVVYKPTNGHVLQEDNSKKTEFRKVQTRQNSHENNSKILTDNSLDHSKTDSVPNQSGKGSAALTKLTVSRQLCFNTSATALNNQTLDRAVHSQQKQPKDGNPALKGHSSSNKGKSLPSRKVSNVESESYHVPNGIDGHDESLQSSKYALTNISQNAPVDGVQAVQAPSSSTRGLASSNDVTQSSQATDVGVSGRHKRQTIHHEESSDSSSTDKENKNKNPDDVEVPSPSKKLKRDATLYNLSSSRVDNTSEMKRTITQRNKKDSCALDSSQEKIQSARSSTLRSRNLLSPAETLPVECRSPKNQTSERKKAVLDKNSLKTKEKSTGKNFLSPSKKYSDKQQVEVNLKQSYLITTPKKSTSPKKQRHAKDPRASLSDQKPDNQSRLSHKNKSLNISDASKITKTSFTLGSAATDKQDQSVTSQESGSDNRRRSLRDRSLLLTPESLQLSRQYPVAYLSSRQRKALIESNFERTHKPTSKTIQQETSISRKSTYASGKTESASSSKERNKGSQDPAKNSSNNKKSVGSKNKLTHRDFSLNSPSSFSEHLQETERSSQNSQTIAISVRETNNERVRIQTGTDSEVCPGTQERGGPVMRLQSKGCNAYKEKNYATKTASTSSSRVRTQTKSGDSSSLEFMPQPEQGKGGEKAAESKDIQPRMINARSSMSKAAAQSRRFSLPRKPGRINSDEQGSKESVEDNVSLTLDLQSPQLSTTLVDASWKQPQKIAHKKHKAPAQGRKQPANTEKAGTSSERAGISSKRASTSSEKAGISSGESGTSSERAGTSSERPGISSERPGISSEKTGTFSGKSSTSNKKSSTSSEKSSTSSERAGMSSERAGTSGETGLGKQPRKRKLVNELQRVKKPDSGAGSNNDAGQKVMLWCDNGKSRRGSDVTAFDLVLQAVTETEEQLLDETDGHALRNKVVMKVMRNLKKSIKPLISKAREVKSLEHDIRQRSRRCHKLMDVIKETRQKRMKLQSERESGDASNKNTDVIHVSEWMKGYSQLMHSFANRPR